ncbi:hypothetical protein [Marinococcus luteus]|uniref:hypothetical protein n=1 Tax=Marinococcus luteus TaxID=1122204 RepID=UPI002ACCD14E|nr:hypothetical protein [Marinococcus luteus]MDZ5784571.1 hypothetical protein [Marinococcus luteus]
MKKLKVDEVFTDDKEQLHYTDGELEVRDDNGEDWEVKLYGVDNQRFFTDALKNNEKKHLTFETDKGSMYGLVSVEALDNAGVANEDVVTLVGTGPLNGFS